MKVLPPGNILQNLYFKERIRENRWSSFLEIGSGNGFLSRLMLESGMTGVGCDLNAGACENNAKYNGSFVESGKYRVENCAFSELDSTKQFDMVLAAMVIEHLDEDDLAAMIADMKKALIPGGSLVFFVPASKAHWGIEDEIAGHFLRYEFDDIEQLAVKNDLRVQHLVGLTYPLSNWMFSLSNALIKRAESDKLVLNQKERTVYTGNRNVPYKTTFPAIFGLILNETVMRPFHWMQKLNLNNGRSLVIYTELKVND